MSKLWEVPIQSIVSLNPEQAVRVIRAILRSECGYAKLGPLALTISNRLMTPDGGIDAEINIPHGHVTPVDCIFRAGIIGYQIKSGATFKPWKRSSVQSELLNSKGELSPEVARLIRRNGNYAIISLAMI